jgi:hypothetical protein
MTLVAIEEHEGREQYSHDRSEEDDDDDFDGALRLFCSVAPG